MLKQTMLGKKDIDRIVSLAYESGKLGLKHFGRVGVERKPDRSFVTDADREIELLVRRELRRITPGYGILGEEQGLEKGEHADSPYWVVDPLDGTGVFVSGIPCWSFSLGLVQGEEAVFGIIYIPVTDELYWTGHDGRVYLNGAPCEPVQPAVLDSQAVLYNTNSDIYREYRIEYTGKIRCLGSAAYHGVLTHRPYTAAVLQGRLYLWDMAAVLAINEAWGIKAADLEGNPVKISEWRTDKTNRVPVLLAHPDNFDAVASTIKRTG
ncbi:MAG: inositol monophosphatase family protein [Gemmatimonadota bacterium]|nr:inositol monophosphatase family protein [Gemmatimonadota bacterium]